LRLYAKNIFLLTTLYFGWSAGANNRKSSYRNFLITFGYHQQDTKGQFVGSQISVIIIIRIMPISYEELQLNQGPPSTKERLQQIALLLVLGGGFALFSFWDAGVFSPVVVAEDVFPGGEFIYKFVARDYAVCGGNMRRLASDCSMLESDDWNNLFYCVFLDDDSQIPSDKTRFFVGAIVDQTNRDKKEALLEKNLLLPETGSSTHVFADFIQGSKPSQGKSEQFWKQLPYKKGKLPKVKSALVQFRFTNGFVSSLIYKYKVTPALIKYAKQHGVVDHPLTIVTCSVHKKICTHYAVSVSYFFIFFLTKIKQSSPIMSLLVYFYSHSKRYTHFC